MTTHRAVPIALPAIVGAVAGYLLGTFATDRTAPPTAASAPPAATDASGETDGVSLRATVEELRASRDALDARATALGRELEALRKERPLPASPPSPVGWWYHATDGGESTLLDFREGGEVVVEGHSPRWKVDGWRLRITWPDAKAPGGAWVDDCLLSADGASYAGKNQNGNLIRGTRKPE